MKLRWSRVALSDPLHGNGEHISNAALGLDHARGARVAFELAPEPENLHVDAAIEDILVHAGCLQQLLARVRAVLRRFDVSRTAPARDPERGRFRFSGWQLDRRIRQLTDPAGTPVALTKGEYAMLLAFLEAPQRPLSREQLLQATRVHEDVFDRSIDVQILRLRRKLERDPSAPRVIQTERGVGYVFAVAVERF